MSDQDLENENAFENPEPEADSLVSIDSDHLNDETDERAEGDIGVTDNGIILEVQNEGQVNACNVTEGPDSVVDNQDGCQVNGNDDLDIPEIVSDPDDKAEDELGLEYIREGQVTSNSEDQSCDILCSNAEQTEADACFASQMKQYSEENGSNQGKDMLAPNTSDVTGTENGEMAEANATHASDSSEQLSEASLQDTTNASAENNCDNEVKVTTYQTSVQDTDSHHSSGKLTVQVIENTNDSCKETSENISDTSDLDIGPENATPATPSCDSLDSRTDSNSDPVRDQRLSPSESIESHEPECDQEIDNTSEGDEDIECNIIDVKEQPSQSGPCNMDTSETEDSDPSGNIVNVSMVTGTENANHTPCVLNNENVNICQNKPPQSAGAEGADSHVMCSRSNVSNSTNSGDIMTQSLSSDDDLLSELESELTNRDSNQGNSVVTKETSAFKNVNGFGDLDEKVLKQFQDQQSQLKAACAKLRDQDEEIQRLKAEKEDQQSYCEDLIKERDSYLQQIHHLKSHSADDLYLPQIKELEYTLSQQQTEIKALKDKLTSHDAAAKRAVATLQNELKMRIEQATKMQEETNREKDTMVVKYAQAEKKFLEGQKTMERLEAKVREANRERESLTNKLREAKNDLKKTAAELESKSSELQQCSKELEKHKEMISSADVRIKWAQNKLRAELESHKETKTELDKTKLKLKDAKEETEQIRKDCQAIVKTYQESEEIKSNALDSQLKEKESEFKQQQQEKTDQEEIYQATVKELEQLKNKHRETITELQTFRDKVKCLEEERIQSEQTMNKFKEMLQKQKKENKELQTKVEELVQVKSDFKRAQCTIKSLDSEISELKISNKDLLIEIEACRRRETEKLELTEKLSAKNAALQSENSNLHNQSSTQASELAALRMELQSLESKFNDVSDGLDQERSMRTEETSRLKEKLEEKTRSVDELSIKLEDEKNEIKTLKRKHVNNIKDLTRQLQQTRKKLETFEANGDMQKDTVSMGSRTSSNGSLNTLGTSENNMVSSNVNYQNMAPSTRFTPPQEQIQEYPLITEQVEPDRQVLIERIVKLQRGHARKNEKIEFMDDHIHQLIDEIQKKNKIIQSYAMREEAGTLTPEEMDINKTSQRRLSQAQLSKKHSIMGSVYSSHQTDSGMTLDLSLEINKKLQAVLEDALLKNITLKESLDTLGEEIARLSQENRQLQIQIQGKKQKR